ncbi:MAG: pyridoxal phosphate-dependent aminotransferase [Hyphomicrobiales bacterium]|nr:pyridoxal phosphate-dependent aminotransferase [Hyphomicrobiales bacterium]
MLLTTHRMSQLGTESAFEVLARAKALEAAGENVINLGIGQPDFRTPDHIVEAAIKAARDGHHGYTPASGIAELRVAVTHDIARRRGIEIDPDCVLIVPGGKVTMYFAAVIFGEAGTEILYPNPGFPIYESIIRFSDAIPVPYPLREENGFAFDAGEVLSLVNGNTRLIIINSPANPTGGVVPKAEINLLVAGLESFPNVAILSDEIYGRMLYDGREHVSLLSYDTVRDRVILLDGWSKTYAMTGWRLGYSVWPRDLVDMASRLAINSYSCVNAPTQYAGIAALEGPQNKVDEMVAAFDERRGVIVQELNQIDGFSCIEPGGAFYAFPNVSGSGRDARSLQDSLLEEAGVAVIAGTSFGDNGEGFLRFSYANTVDNIREAMRRIRAWL